jgi:uncharacterized protein (TIGR02453 family)
MQAFEPTIFQFLEELADNNNRPWFAENKGRYEREVLKPCLEFIRAMAPRLKKISEFFVASDRRVGGSLLRVYRDTRFSRDRTPYKTNAGIQFRHEFGRDIHAPGFYVHIAPRECFLALGLWRPDSASLSRIRQAIVQRPDRWQQARDDRKFRRRFVLEGDRLKRPPRGFPADHPHAEDLKRTDFIGLEDLSEQDVLAKKFLDRVAASFAAGQPLMRFLCDALKVPF